jgi:hypothetical protein
MSGAGHPVGSQYDRQSHLASQTLPAAGAYTAQAFQPTPKGTSRVTYWITYQRGAVGGYPVFQHQYTNGTDTAREIVLGTPTTSNPNTSVPLGLELIDGPIPADGGAISYAITYERLPAACVGVRLLVAEMGNAANPGTIAITLTTDTVE